MNFSKFLELKFLEWQQKEGGRKTVSEFAEHVGFSPSAVSLWWNGTRKPTRENIRKLAEVLGPEVYDALGLERPDPLLTYVAKSWDELKPEQARAIAEQVEKYVTENDKKSKGSGNPDE